MRVGSLFSGYGGLDLAVVQTLGGSVAWHAEVDPAASAILAHHWPAVPNLGDVTAVDWAAVEPVDVLCGGFPCQDVSAAGRRAGLAAGTRSGLWAQMARAIDRLRPRLVVVENVRGLLSAPAQHPAHRDVESCEWCLGDHDARPLRALGAVLGDLADLGFDARWCGLRAADVGAPHGRFRVFLAAWPAGADPAALRFRAAGRDDGVRAARLVPEPADALRPGRGAGGPAGGGRRPAGEEGRPDARRGDRGAVPDASGDGRGEGRPEPAGFLGGSDAAFGGGAAGDPDGDRLTVVERFQPGLGARPDPDRRGQVDWGPYALAVRRWERRLGRPAPAPAQPGPRTGNPRLAPAFVEWLMGLDDGHVTAVPGLTRNDQLRALGNGVVPQQAAEALRRLLTTAGA